MKKQNEVDMKIRKKDEQMIFELNNIDLLERDIDIKIIDSLEMKQKIPNLIKELSKYFQKEFGTVKGVAVEVKVSNEDVIVVMTKCDSIPEEFLNDEMYEDVEDDEIDTESKEVQKGPVIYYFKHMNDVLKLSEHANMKDDGLIAYQNRFYLKVNEPTHEDTRLLEQFGYYYGNDDTQWMLIKEHGNIIFETDALLKCKEI